MDFIKKVYNILDDQRYKITFYPAENDNWMMECNGHFIGGIFDKQLCYIYTDSTSVYLSNPEPVFYGYSNNATHKMLVCPIELAKSVLIQTYQEHHESKRFICDLSQHFKSNFRYPDKIMRDYELFKIFLQFSYENGLLKYQPLDDEDRILYMTYVQNDLTEKGILIFEKLMVKWLTYTDRTDKISNIKMLNKYYSQLESEKRLSI
ncbi:MAG: hypothetical protein ACR2MS_01565 [Weeksellaceae bacterium]